MPSVLRSAALSWVMNALTKAPMSERSRTPKGWAMSAGLQPAGSAVARMETAPLPSIVSVLRARLRRTEAVSPVRVGRSKGISGRGGRPEVSIDSEKSARSSSRATVAEPSRLGV